MVDERFPEGALLWARRIPDPALRRRALDRVEATLRERHPNWVEELLGADTAAR